MKNTKAIISPRIQNLCRELEADNAAALKDFWDEVRENGSPIIEKAEDGENYLVTLVWKESEPIDRIAVIGEMFGYDSADAELEKLQGTDLWYRTWRANGSAKSLYMFIINEKEGQGWDELDIRLDPFNSNKYICIKDDSKPGECYLLSSEESFVCLPDFKEKSWTIERQGVHKGKVELIEEFESKILNNKRRIWIYTPAGYSEKSEPLPMALFTDGWEYVHVTRVITTLDNLIADGEIPAICAVFIDSNEDRDKELTCSEKFNSFIVKELLPWVNENYKISSEASRNLVAGFSYGGLAAAFIAYQYPEMFPKVLSQSGGMLWNGYNDNNKKGMILGIYEDGPKKPIEFYMTFGEFEKKGNINYKSNLDFYEILKNKGYKAEYKEFIGGHTFTDIDIAFGDGIKHLLGKNNAE